MYLNKTVEDFYLSRSRSSDSVSMSPRDVGWTSLGDQSLRSMVFDQMLDLRVRSGKSVLDVGCGYGYFCNYLNLHRRNMYYTGWDPNTRFLEYATSYLGAYPNYNLLPIDIESLPDPYYMGQHVSDFVVASGLFLVYYPGSAYDMFRNVERLYCLSGTAAVFNFLTRSDDHARFYIDTMDVLGFCRSLTSRISYREDYIDGDCTIVLWRDHG